MKRSNIHYAVTFGIRILIFLIALTTAKNLLSSEFQPFISWWLTLLAITITFYPVIGLLFHKFHDGGWVFSKSIGIALSGYMMWFFSSIRLFRFNHTNTVVILYLCLIVNIGIVAAYYFFLPKEGKKRKPIYELYEFDFDKAKSMVSVEIIFFLVFLIWIYFRGFRPEVSNTESPMDYGFMAAMMRSDYMPPQDIWLAGKSINYYYVGQYMATFLTKLSNVRLQEGYNLSLMTIAGIGFTLAYSLIYNVMFTFISDRELPKRKTLKKAFEVKVRRFHRYWCALSGLIAGIAVIFAGNMHYVIYYWIVGRWFGNPESPRWMHWFDKPKEVYWWPDSTRYIGYNPDVAGDKTIHEFPSYSFILGDLHAHVVNIIFIMSVLGLLYALLLIRKSKMDDLRLGVSIKRPNFKKEAFHPIILLLGFFIGLFHMTNYWDYPIYYVVSGAIILFSNAILYQFSLDTLKLTGAHAVVIIGIAKIVSLPFELNFDKISTGIRLTYNRTMPYQLLVLWGLPILIVAYYVITRYRDLWLEGFITKKSKEYFSKKLNKKGKILSKNEKDESFVIFGGEKNKLYQFIEHLPVADLFIVTLGLCAIGLIILPEVIYVKDIYDDYARANTMFKLTYQGFIMFGLCMGYILVRGLIYGRLIMRRIAAFAGILLLLWTAYYPVTAIDMWYQPKKETFKNLDSIEFMQNRCNDDYAAINWLNENVQGMKVIVESYGASYSEYNRISAFTGLPTVIGWQTHEFLWRSEASGDFPPIITERHEDVTTIYTSMDSNEILYYLKKYEVDYIYLGKLEDEKFGNENHEILKQLGEIVFYSEPDSDKDYESVIIKIDKSAYDYVIQIDETLNDGLANPV